MEQAGRYQFRAEELRASLDQLSSPECRAAIEAIAHGYERMARSAERVDASRKALNVLPPMASEAGRTKPR